MVQMSDEQLAKEVSEGSDDSFHKLLERHGQSIFKFARRMTAQKEEAEDIVQETFLRFWLNAEKYQAQKSKLTTWLHRVAYNLCIDKRRQSQASAKLPSTEMDAAVGPDDFYASAQISRRVAEELSELTEAQRCAVVLTHYQNFSNKEVAHILDISVDALESVLRRARYKLKQNLTEIRQ